MTNLAVKVDGKRPIGARARRIREPRLLLVSYTGERDSGVSTETVCDSLDDLKDYCQPHAPGRDGLCVDWLNEMNGIDFSADFCVCLCVAGALLKAVCVCSGLVSLSSQHPLGEQLMQRWGGGVELHSWSVLPTGSGLGEKPSNMKYCRNKPTCLPQKLNPPQNYIYQQEEKMIIIYKDTKTTCITTVSQYSDKNIKLLLLQKHKTTSTIKNKMYSSYNRKQKLHLAERETFITQTKTNTHTHLAVIYVSGLKKQHIFKYYKI